MSRKAAAAAKRYRSSHWGIDPGSVRKLAIPGLGAEEPVTEMGRLLELRVKPSKSSPHYSIEFEEPGGHRPCVLVFTPDKRERLFAYMPRAYRDVCRDDLVVEREAWHDMNELARGTGGRQAKWPFPKTRVQLLGECTHVVYFTEKQDDGESEYIHQFGEESGIRPVLCVDATGQLWIVGGNYSVPDAGITD